MNDAQLVDARFAVVPLWVDDAVLPNGEPISDRAVRLYLRLRRYSDNDRRTAWPSIARLADDLRCSESSVERAVRELIAVGALTVTARRRSDGGQTSNLYTLRSVPSADVMHTPPSHVTAPPVTHDGGPPSPMTDELRTNELSTPQPPDADASRGCSAHRDKLHASCRACGTSARARRARADEVPRPDWCGGCDKSTRQRARPDGRIERCPKCHPLTQESR